MCISNSGLIDKAKEETSNRGQYKTERVVSGNPLLLVHAPVRCHTHKYEPYEKNFNPSATE